MTLKLTEATRRKRSAYIMRQIQHFSPPGAALREKRETTDVDDLFGAILNLVDSFLSSEDFQVLLQLAGEVAQAAINRNFDEALEGIDDFFVQLDQTISSMEIAE